MIREYVKFSYQNFKTRKLRTFLTVLGIFIGIAAVVSLISIGTGLQETMNEQFEQMGTNKIMVLPGGGGGMGIMSSFTSAAGLTTEDMDVVEKTRGVEQVVEIVMKTAPIKYKGQTKHNFVMGFPPSTGGEMFSQMQGMEVEDGRDLRDSDKYKAVVGIDYSLKLYDKPIGPGDKIIIHGKEFSVVGILGRIGNPTDDASVLIPIDIAKELFETGDQLDMIFVEIKETADPAEVADDIKKNLLKFRDEDEGDESFQVQTSEQLLASVGDIMGMVQAVVIGIAAISIIVGGVGIMNTMYTTVLERTRDIGVMKAIGAQNNDILLMFLIESGSVGLIGGAIGCVIGVSLAKLSEMAAHAQGITILKASITPELIFMALAFSFLIGSISGLMPAKNASELKPVDALRYE